jgi:glycosyltransferase involved in cell wall biosynthesis
VSADKPLLTLVMIVRDEAHTIAKTLESVKGVVDRFDVLDTGSTDGTQGLIKETMGGTPGEVRGGEFVDFATARNLSLDLAGESAEYALLLDADDVLVGGDRLRELLTSVKGSKGVDGHYVPVKVPGCVFPSVRVTRLSAKWRYVGAVHELLLPPGMTSYPPSTQTADGVRIDHLPDARGNEKTSARWERDVKLLRGDLAKNPDNGRACFYLAKTLMEQGKHLEAFKHFEQRVKLGGYPEEVFYSRLMMARCARTAGLPFSKCVELWHSAHSCDPTRIEPLADLAAEYSARDDHAMTVLYARRAFELPPTEGWKMFVEDHSYLVAHVLGWHAYYTGPMDQTLGKLACQRAVALRPNSSAQDAINLALYKKREKPVLSAAHTALLQRAWSGQGTRD